MKAEQYLWEVYLATLFLNVVALSGAYMQSGKAREVLFGEVHSKFAHCCQCLLGPCLSWSLLFALFIGFICHMTIVCCILPTTPIIVLAYAACDKGGFVLSGLATALELSGMVTSAVEVVVLGDFCKVEQDFSVGITLIITGGIMNVIGQVIVLISATYNYVRVLYQLEILQVDLHDHGDLEKSKLNDDVFLQANYNATTIKDAPSSETSPRQEDMKESPVGA